MAKILFKDEEAYDACSNADLLSAGDAGYERDNQGQIVIYTGIYVWKSDGTYRDGPEPEDLKWRISSDW